MNTATKKWREQRVREFQCDICRGDSHLIHEVARGQHRQNAWDKAYATLCLCSPCHDRVHQGMSLAEQLGWLQVRRPDEMDLEAFYKLTGRRYPDIIDIGIHAATIKVAERRTP
jgi:hypothetical protein